MSPPVTRYGRDRPEPTPPPRRIRHSAHHWLENIDGDGHSFGLVVLQWEPVAQKWCRSGQYATGMNVETHGWRYVCECEMPTDDQFHLGLAEFYKNR